MAKVPSRIEELIETFDRNIEAYRSQQYNEAQLRREFIDPFFEELGWDVTNKLGHAQAYKDVIHEDAIKIGGYTKAPDYCFRIGGTRKFFLEAKKPSIDIGGDPHPAYQLRRYAWSAKLPLSILTDFEEFAVYDCQIRPKHTDKASAARIKYLTYKEYIDKWHEISDIFSKDAILKGSFDKFAVSTKGKRGTTTVDKEFLSELEKWRSELARVISLRNSKLSQYEINFAVQRTIDRILFLRMCEDRGIEDYGQLLKISGGKQNYPRLFEVFEKADHKYNSGLFYFHKETGRPEGPDELTPNITIDDNTLKYMLHSLYYPQCPYEFSVLPAEILGNVYEQFLGKVIELTPAHRAEVKEKPEVKKAGGVYYTPSYIVDYIVKNTVGKLCEGKSPKDISKLRILDPACGSGSFLLGAYTYLLDYHRDWYVENEPEKYTKQIYQGRGGQWFLTIAEKKKILLNNIFGVDIDSQAVEVTKLSLLLKVLEGETSETVGQTYKIFHERALPDLGNNIKCGNSLIGPDFFDEPDIDSSDEELHKKINPFDWKVQFSEIFKGKNPGFDAVIGNPPYVDVKILGDQIKRALITRYDAASQRFDLFIPFIEKGLDLLNINGLLGFIIPSMFMIREYGRDLRRVIAKTATVQSIVDFGTNQVFLGPMNYVCITILRKGKFDIAADVIQFRRSIDKHCSIDKAISDASSDSLMRFNMSPASFSEDKEWRLFSIAESKLLEKLQATWPPLQTTVEFASEGIHSGKDQAFYLSSDDAKAFGLETPPIYPLAKGKDIHRYCPINPPTLPNVVIYPYDLDSGSLYPENQLDSIAPKTMRYLRSVRPLLKGRQYFDRSSKRWYELWCPRRPIIYTAPKIIGPEIAKRGEFTLIYEPLFFNNKLKGILLKQSISENMNYVLALLNSSLLTYLHRLIAPPKGGNFFEVKTRIMTQLPIRTIDFDNPDDVKKHDKMVELVERMLELNKKLASSKVPAEKTRIQRQIAATDKQIDKLVYELYGLTEEEIKIIEGATK